MFKYQLIFLGTIKPLTRNLISKYYEKIEDLKLQKEFYEIYFKEQLDSYKGNQPTFIIYFGNENGDFEDLAEIEMLLKDGNIVLPIFFNSFSQEIPKILSNQNGLKYTEYHKDKIVDLVLESFGKLRSSRKVFISYKRDESTSVAIQLYEALEKNNFDVFLDTHSIKQGEPFQDELWHRMTDCDVIVLLNTPKFLESHWCKEEFAEAGTKQIGLVQLVWPNHEIKKIDSGSHISYPLQLKEADFVDNIYNNKDKSKLVEITVEEIIQKIESVRARNLASRQDNLITDFRNIAKDCGRDITVQPEKFLTEDLPSGKRNIYIPTIGIPQSTSCQSAEIRHELEVNKNVSIRLIYDDLRIRDRWLKHLDWLNDNFKKDILTLKKQDFKSWLQTTK